MPRAPLKVRDRVRFHVGTQEVMARVLLVDRAELEPGQVSYGRFRLEAPIVALPGDRYVIRSYSPIVTIGGGTLLDIAPPRFKRKGPALLAHLQLLDQGTAAQVLEEHLRQAGPAGARAADLRARTPFGPDELRQLLEEGVKAGTVLAVDREWYLHRDANDRLRSQTLALLEAFHADNPLRSGISREELRSRAGHAQERVFAQLLTGLEAEGVVRSERDQVRLAAHSIRLSADQQRVVDGLEADYREAGRPRPARRRRWPGTGSRAMSGTSSTRSWWRIGASSGCGRDSTSTRWRSRTSRRRWSPISRRTRRSARPASRTSSA